MQLGYMQIKKTPRVLLAQTEDFHRPLTGLYVMWPDKAHSEIFDLSLSGMCITPAGQLGNVRMDQSIHFELRIEGIDEVIPLEARIVQIKSQSLGLIFESISAQGRLVIEQHIKDQLLAQNLKHMPTTILEPHLRGDLWYHGPFDTNVILWEKKDVPGLEKAIVEYDNLIWIYENGQTLLQRSIAAVGSKERYFSSSMTVSISAPKSAKVSMGASWLDRLIKVIDQANQPTGELSSLLQVLRKLRGH